jgi:hypothetical protein
MNFFYGHVNALTKLTLLKIWLIKKKKNSFKDTILELSKWASPYKLACKAGINLEI